MVGGMELTEDGHPPSARKICSALKRLREDSGLSQMELATRVGVPQNYISRWEQGRVPGLEDLWILETVGLLIEHGTVLRAAGFVGAEPGGHTTREMIESDPQLPGKTREMLLAAYDAATT